MPGKTIKVCVRRHFQEITPSGYDPGLANEMDDYEGKQIEVVQVDDDLYKGVSYSWAPEWLKFKNGVIPKREW